MNMLSKAYNIEFTGFYQGQQYYLRTYDYEYRSLMALLRDKIYPDDFGQCGGMGRCGTCLVNISGTENNRAGLPRNENTTLSKMGMEDGSTRLSCQIQIDEELRNAVVEIVDNVY